MIVDKMARVFIIRKLWKLVQNNQFIEIIIKYDNLSTNSLHTMKIHA